MNINEAFKKPQANVKDESAITTFSTTSFDFLRRVRPWLIFIAISELLFAIMQGATVIYILTSGLQLDDKYDFIGVVSHIASSIAFLIAAISLFKYSGAIKRFLVYRNSVYLDQTQNAQLNVWRTYGAGIIIYILGGLYAPALFLISYISKVLGI